MLTNYRKFPSVQGQGTGPGNYILIYATDDNTISRLTSLIVCNSSSNEKTFSLWQVDNNIWPAGEDWDQGNNAEPSTAIKDRIFYNVVIPGNTTFTANIEFILDQKQFLIFEAPTDLSITVWGEEDKDN